MEKETIASQLAAYMGRPLRVSKLDYSTDQEAGDCTGLEVRASLRLSPLKNPSDHIEGVLDVTQLIPTSYHKQVCISALDHLKNYLAHHKTPFVIITEVNPMQGSKGVVLEAYHTSCLDNQLRWPSFSIYCDLVQSDKLS